MAMNVQDLLSRSRNTYAAIVMVAALLLALVVGLVLLLGVALGAFVLSQGAPAAVTGAPGAVAAAPGTALLLPVLVLLAAILILLLILLWCICGKCRKQPAKTGFPTGLLGIVPFISSQLPTALHGTALLLRAGAEALGPLQVSLKAAGDALQAAHDATDWFSVDVPTIETTPVGGAPPLDSVHYISGLSHTTIGLDNVRTQIQNSATRLLEPVTLRQNEERTDVEKLQEAMNSAADLLDGIANAISP